MSGGGGYPAQRALRARAQMLLESLAPPSAIVRAEALLAALDTPLVISHAAGATSLSTEISDRNRHLRVTVGWRRSDVAERALCMLRDLPSERWPAQAPLHLLLPDAQTLHCTCTCGRPQPCAHALAALHLFARVAEVDPSILCTDASPYPPVAAPMSEALAGAPTAMPMSVSNALTAFWTYAPTTQSELPADLADLEVSAASTAAGDITGFQRKLHELMLGVREMLFGRS